MGLRPWRMGGGVMSRRRKSKQPRVLRRSDEHSASKRRHSDDYRPDTAIVQSGRTCVAGATYLIPRPHQQSSTTTTLPGPPPAQQNPGGGNGMGNSALSHIPPYPTTGRWIWPLNTAIKCRSLYTSPLVRRRSLQTSSLPKTMKVFPQAEIW